MKSKIVKTIRGADHFIANKDSDVSKEFQSIRDAINEINAVCQSYLDELDESHERQSEYFASIEKSIRSS